MTKLIDVLNGWTSNKNINCVYRDSGIFEEPNSDRLFPSHFQYIEDRNYAISHDYNPIIIDDILVRLIKYDVNSNEFAKALSFLKEADSNKRKFYAKLYIYSITEYPSNIFQVIKKLDLLNCIMNELFTNDEQLCILDKLLTNNQNEIACELIHRGFYYDLKIAAKHKNVGLLFYYISLSKLNDLKYSHDYVEHSSAVESKFKENDNSEDFMEIFIDNSHVDTREEISRFYKIRLDELKAEYTKETEEMKHECMKEASEKKIKDLAEKIDVIEKIIEKMFEPKNPEDPYYRQINETESIVENDKYEEFESCYVDPNEVNPHEDMKRFYKIRMQELQQELSKDNCVKNLQILYDEIEIINNIFNKKTKITIPELETIQEEK